MMRVTLAIIGVCALVSVWCAGAHATAVASDLTSARCTYETTTTGTLVIRCPRGGAR